MAIFHEYPLFQGYHHVKLSDKCRDLLVTLPIITVFSLLLLQPKNWHELCNIIIKEEEMIALTRHEIIDELLKLGVIYPDEVQDYSMEYMIYYKVKCLKLN